MRFHETVQAVAKFNQDVATHILNNNIVTVDTWLDVEEYESLVNQDCTVFDNGSTAEITGPAHLLIEELVYHRGLDADELYFYEAA